MSKYQFENMSNFKFGENKFKESFMYNLFVMISVW